MWSTKYYNFASKPWSISRSVGKLFFSTSLCANIMWRERARVFVFTNFMLRFYFFCVYFETYFLLAIVINVLLFVTSLRFCNCVYSSLLCFFIIIISFLFVSCLVCRVKTVSSLVRTQSEKKMNDDVVFIYIHNINEPASTSKTRYTLFYLLVSFFCTYIDGDDDQPYYGRLCYYVLAYIPIYTHSTENTLSLCFCIIYVNRFTFNFSREHSLLLYLCRPMCCVLFL